jgi:tripartite-type tricarboxylate transporter receptor subunit TctC
MIRSIFCWVGLGCIAAAAALAPLPATAAQDAGWPTKPVTFIVPFPPGGSVDPLARLVGARLTAALGQQFIVDNRPGGSGSIGAAAAAKASPDGYTFLVVFDTHAVNPTLIPKLPFDTTKDLVPVMLVGTAPMAIVTHPGKPYKSFTDVIKAAKAKPDTLTYGSIGSGSLGHLTMKLLEQAGGFVAVHVPYKGGGPMIVDATGGHVETGIASVSVLAPHVKGGKLRAIAVTGDKRSHAMPEVPALAEQGFPGFSALAWWGIFGTAGTPKPILDKFHAELVKVFNLPEVRRQLADTLGMDLVVSSPEALQKFLLGEIMRWGKVVREHNIRGD